MEYAFTAHAAWTRRLNIVAKDNFPQWKRIGPFSAAGGLLPHSRPLVAAEQLSWPITTHLIDRDRDTLYTKGLSIVGPFSPWLAAC